MIDADELNLSREVFRPVQLFQSERPHQYLPRVCAAAVQSVQDKEIGKGVHKKIFGMFACEFLDGKFQGRRKGEWLGNPGEGGREMEIFLDQRRRGREGCKVTKSHTTLINASQAYRYIDIILGLAQNAQLGQRAGTRHVWDLFPTGR